MTFLEPQSLYLLTAAPLVAFAMLWGLWARRRSVARFYGAGSGRPWAPMPSIARGVIGCTLWSLAVACIALALARPAHSPQPRKVERSGRDVVFVIDVSRSMLAQDLRPSRLERAKLMVSDVLDSAEGDRVGIVAFAGTPVVRCPMTTDYTFARMSLEAVNPDSVGRGGTAIGDAIRSALALVRAGQDERALAADIYLLTDGEDHETRPLEAAQEAAQLGVRLVTIGLGSDTGAPVPIDSEQTAGPGRAHSRDGYMEYGGERVQSRMNAAALRSIAEATPGGVFLDVGVGNLELDRVYRLLRRDGQKKQIEATESVRYTEAFQIPLGGAIVFGVMAMLIEGLYFRVRRPTGMGAAVAAAVLVLMLCATPARAQSVEDDLREGSRLLKAGKPGEALSLLEGASVRHPEAAAIALGRGCAQLALKQTAEAEASFRKVEQLAIGTDEASASRARFNLGLIEAQRGAALAEKEPKEAVKSLEQAERWFRNARPGLAGAERNAAASHIEALQLAREALRKKIAEQEEQQKQQQEQSQQQSGDSGQKGDGKSGKQSGKSDQQSGQPQDQQQSQDQNPSAEQKSAEDLANLARQQEEAANKSQKTEQQQGQTPQQKKDEAQKLAEEQKKLSEQAEKLDDQLKKQQAEAKSKEAQQAQQSPDQKPTDKQSDQLGRSRDKLDEARQAQARAEEQLRQGDTKAAEQAQREAAEKIKDAARSALGIDQQQGEQQEQAQEPQEGEQKGKEDQRAFNATAANILDREAKQREAIRRFLKSQQRTRTPPVEKDW